MCGKSRFRNIRYHFTTFSGWCICISKDEKNLGVALIDIGGGSTTIALFEQGDLKSTTVLPVGGDHITKDFSIGLRTSSEDAEKIKLKYGHAFYDHASEDEVFNVSNYWK